MRKCQACGSEQLSDGYLVSTGAHLFVYGTEIEFKLERGKGKCMILGEACLKCGHLELGVDLEELRKKSRK